MYDEAAKEEPDKQRRLEVDWRLIRRGGLREPEEEEEPSQEKGGIVGVHHRPPHEQDVHHDDPWGNGDQGLARLVDLLPRPHDRDRHARQRRELPPEDEEVRGIRHEDGQHRTPAEVLEHEGGAPVPCTSHHQHGRGGEMRERAADGHIAEQQPQRRVLQPGTGAELVELAAEQQGRNRHRGWFGHERSEYRRKRQDGQPPCRGRASPQVCDALQRRFRHDDNRPGRGERHDHHDEERLGVIHRVVHVVLGRRPSQIRGDDGQEHDRPEPEHHFHLAKEVQHLGGDARTLGSPARPRAGVVPVLHGVSERHEPRRHERVHDGDEEHHRHHKVQRVMRDPFGKRGQQPVGGRGGIRGERGRKDRRGIGGNHLVSIETLCECLTGTGGLATGGTLVKGRERRLPAPRSRE